MIHKAFEVIGERVMIRNVLDTTQLLKYRKILNGKSDYIALDVSRVRELVRSGVDEKLGIFQESERFRTTLEGGRSALDFIEPVYNPNPIEEEYAKGINPRERVNPKNPILSFHYGIDHLKLKYIGNQEGTHVFKGNLNYVQGVFYNDGNFEVFNKYVEPLRKAGFEIYPVGVG